MFQVSVFYESPRDPGAFDSHYSTIHRTLLTRLSGLRHATMNWPRAQSADDPSPYHAVTVMYWDDRASALDSLRSPSGRDAAEDAANSLVARSFNIFAESRAIVPFTPFPAGAEICGVLGLYGMPGDEAAFRTHYEMTHSVLAARMPLQTAFTVSWAVSRPDREAPEYHLIGNQEWRSEDDFELCLASPEAAAAIDDLSTFVDGGMTMLSCKTLVVV